VGPHAWKKYFLPPRLRLWQARRDGKGFRVEPEREDPPRLALVGARPCELHAIAIQDRVLLEGAFRDPHYAARRRELFVLAVNCAVAGGTCFCASMQTGPRASAGFDLALTELLAGPGGHRFLVEVGTAAGARVLARIATGPATDGDRRAALEVSAETERRMGRRLDTSGIRDLLARNLEHPRWDEVAERCLACANCTLACPTCFCTAVEDTTDLAGATAERTRRWDSCFMLDFSYVHGGPVRATTRARYRQWLTHKLGTWIDQFGTSGCVGCGRCITWCPVGIDLTEEAAAIRATDGARTPGPRPPAAGGGGPGAPAAPLIQIGKLKDGGTT
jgi:ferredoxin